jgi:hypothetical protein
VHLALCGPRVLLLSQGTVGVGLVSFFEHEEPYPGNDSSNNWRQILLYFVQSVGRHHVVVIKECLKQLGSVLAWSPKGG